MKPNDVLNLAASSIPVLELAIRDAGDNKYVLGKINNVAQQLLRGLRTIQLDQDLRPEVPLRAAALSDHLRGIAQISCRRYEMIPATEVKL